MFLLKSGTKPDIANKVSYHNNYWCHYNVVVVLCVYTCNFVYM